MASLYDLFGLPSTCTDDQLRREYHRAVRDCHPDLNPGQTEWATSRTQQLTTAYATLKEHRRLRAATQERPSEEISEMAVGSMSVAICFSFDTIDLDDIARRKTSFRRAWEAFRQEPSSVLRALRLIHSAHQAERQKTVQDLLKNPVLVDSAPLILDQAPSAAASDTLIRWADFLYEHDMAEAGIQILEDSLSTGKVDQRIPERLRSMHYGCAQGYAQGSGGKPDPDDRIRHLRRILELGFEYGYVYKLLAEAHHELGNDSTAREHLAEAYRVDPQLSGAVRISRALGFLPPKPRSTKKRRAKHRYTRPDQIPTPGQIRSWAERGNWEEILEYADLKDYSPRLVPKSRSTIRQIAASLGGCRDSQAMTVLESYLESVYWDVRTASLRSLARIGNRQTLQALETFCARNSREQVVLEEATSYLTARLQSKPGSGVPVLTDELMEQTLEALRSESHGTARFLLEDVVSATEQNHPSYQQAILLLSQACAGMGDSSEAIRLMKQVLPALDGKARRKALRDLAGWLWNHLAFEPYDPANDPDYLRALEIHRHLALTSTRPRAVLRNLRRLTRWMEILGEGETARWIRALIRTSAPGTRYVDRHDREQYVKQVTLSGELVSALVPICRQIKDEMPKRIARVLEGQNMLDGPDYASED
jgi:hypothetical protein